MELNMNITRETGVSKYKSIYSLSKETSHQVNK